MVAKESLIRLGQLSSDVGEVSDLWDQTGLYYSTQETCGS